MKKRLKSPIVWLSVLAQVCIIVAMFAPEISEQIKVIGTVVVEIATILGVLNNPTDKENF